MRSFQQIRSPREILALPVAAAAALLMPVFSASTAHAQVNYRVLAVTGDTIDTRRGSTVRFGSVADPAINNQNQVAYRAFVYGRGVNRNNDEAIVLQRLFRRTGEMVASENQALTAGYLAQNSKSEPAATTTRDDETTTTVQLIRSVGDSQLGNPAGTSTFGNRLGLSSEGVVVFIANTSAFLETETRTTVVNNTTGEETETTTNSTGIQFPITMFATDGRTPVPLISETPATGSLHGGPQGLFSFGAATGESFGPFASVSKGRVVIDGQFFNPRRISLSGQGRLDINLSLDGGEASLQNIVLAGDLVPGLPINNSPTFGTTESGLLVQNTTLPAMNVGGIATLFVTTDSQTVDSNFGANQLEANRFRGLWNFSPEEKGTAFFIGRGSPVVDANGDIVGLFSAFGGSDSARNSEALPLTVAGSSNGLVCFTGQMIDNDGNLMPEGLFFSRVLPNGANFEGVPGRLLGPGPNADKQLPYLPNGVAFQSVAVGADILVQNPFPNTNRNEVARAPLASIAQAGINNRGTVVFQGAVALGGSALFPVNGIWAIPFGARQPGNREPVCIALEGDIITINRKARKVVAIRFNPYNGLNDANRLVYTVSFDDATSAVMFANIQQNTGYIE